MPATGARLLAFDTATERIAAVLTVGAEAAFAVDAEGGAAASTTLLPQLRALLARAGLTLHDLDAVACGCGPGAFTGLRTATAVAQGLAFGLGLPVLRLDSLLVVADDAHAQAGAPAVFEVGVAVDARLDEAYAAGYRRGADGRWQVVDAPALLALPGLQAQWDRRGWAVVAGSALTAFGARLQAPAGSTALPTVADRAAALGRLARQAFAAGEGVDAAQALPLYLRDKVAQTTAERAVVAAALAVAAPLAAVPGGAAAARRAAAPRSHAAAPTATVPLPGAPAASAGGAPAPGAAAAEAPGRLGAMTDADLDDVQRIEVQAYGHPWSRGNFGDSLRAGHVAEVLRDAAADGGAVLGYFVAQPGVDELHLLNLTVAPDRQGRGLGRRLMAAVQAHGRARRLATLWLEVRQSNQRARALYRRLGFAEVGQRRGYYPAGSQREDAVVMRLALDADADDTERGRDAR